MMIITNKSDLQIARECACNHESYCTNLADAESAEKVEELRIAITIEKLLKMERNRRRSNVSLNGDKGTKYSNRL